MPERLAMLCDASSMPPLRSLRIASIACDSDVDAATRVLASVEMDDDSCVSRLLLTASRFVPCSAMLAEISCSESSEF
jgi:hypothetical protein